MRGSETVLLVEDQPLVRNTLRRLLVRGGYRVFVAGSGPEALELVAAGSEHFDVLLSDVVMPGMTGPQLARKLVERRPDLRVLFMSGHCDLSVVDTRVRDMELPILQKPVTSEMVLRAIRTAIEETAT